jgi:hypothetical protein
VAEVASRRGMGDYADLDEQKEEARKEGTGGDVSNAGVRRKLRVEEGETEVRARIACQLVRDPSRMLQERQTMLELDKS